MTLDWAQSLNIFVEMVVSVSPTLWIRVKPGTGWTIHSVHRTLTLTGPYILSIYPSIIDMYKNMEVVAVKSPIIF